jgi:hypothetical protein
MVSRIRRKKTATVRMSRPSLREIGTGINRDVPPGETPWDSKSSTFIGALILLVGLI